MMIEDKRKNGTYVEVDHPTIEIGDVVETYDGRLCLVIWSDETGRPHWANPGYKGLLGLDNHKAYTSREHFPTVRKVRARLIIEKE